MFKPASRSTDFLGHGDATHSQKAEPGSTGCRLETPLSTAHEAAGEHTIQVLASSELPRSHELAYQHDPPRPFQDTM